MQSNSKNTDPVSVADNSQNASESITSLLAIFQTRLDEIMQRISTEDRALVEGIGKDLANLSARRLLGEAIGESELAHARAQVVNLKSVVGIHLRRGAIATLEELLDSARLLILRLVRG